MHLLLVSRYPRKSPKIISWRILDKNHCLGIWVGPLSLSLGSYFTTTTKIKHHNLAVPFFIECELYSKRFHFSKESILSQPTAWLFNKKSKHIQEQINLFLMWLQATGIFTSFPNKYPNSGITVPYVIEPKCDLQSSNITLNCQNEIKKNYAKSLSFHQLSSAFLVLCFGYSLALLAFAFECLFGVIVENCSMKKTYTFQLTSWNFLLVLHVCLMNLH